MEIVALDPDDLKEVMILENMGFSLGRWSVGSWASELDGPGRLVLGARENGALLGVAAFSVIDETADMLRITVDPAHRRRGIARELLAYGLNSICVQTKATRMLLEVEKNNKPAVKLYEQQGFREISRRKDYYGAGADAIIMEKRLA
ncbi:MAG: ribosomal protein S18-alanine N-acetyltransferase [Propionibacteriaceae bacterium]